EMQFANTPPQIDPHVGFVENAKILMDEFQPAKTIVVEGRGVHQLPIQQLAQAVFHLSRGVVGVSQRQNFAGLRVAFAHQPLNAVSEDGSFARAGSRDYQHGTVHMLNGLALALVGSERSWAGTRLRKRHCESEYHLTGSRGSPSSDIAIATAAIAAVSARRIVGPSVAKIHPELRKSCSS